MSPDKGSADRALEPNADTPIVLHIIAGWFHATVIKLSSCNRDHMLLTA